MLSSSNNIQINKKKFIIHKQYIYLFIILVFSFLTKAAHINAPEQYIFDEVYCGYTAEQYAENNIDAWSWLTKAPEGFAYNWVHPPLGGLIISLPIRFFGKNSLSRRIMPFVAGILISFMVFQLGIVLFPQKPQIALLAAAFFSLDGLGLTLSRISLVDTLITLFILNSTFFAFKKSYVWSAIFLGMACSVKWTALYLIFFLFLLFIMECTRKKKTMSVSLKFLFRLGLLYFFLIVGIYLLSYLPFILHFGIDNWLILQTQMLSFHLKLNATHSWQSNAWTWPFNYRPVWMFVEYGEAKTRNIYAMGNPLIFWGGILSFIYGIKVLLSSYATPYLATSNSPNEKTTNEQWMLFYLMAVYILSFLPWCFSPRLMFLYHYLPAVPFLCLILAFSLYKITETIPGLHFLPIFYTLISFLSFSFFYPYWTGISVPNQYIFLFHWLKSWAP